MYIQTGYWRILPARFIHLSLLLALLVQHFCTSSWKKKKDPIRPVQVLLKNSCRNSFLREDDTEGLMLSNSRNEILASLKSVGIWEVWPPCIPGDLDCTTDFCADLVKLLLKLFLFLKQNGRGRFLHAVWILYFSLTLGQIAQFPQILLDLLRGLLSFWPLLEGVQR